MLISTTALVACGGSEEMSQQTNQAGQVAVAAGADGSKPEAAGEVYSGEGDITELSGNKVTISHGPIEGIGWPAMTMGFSAGSPEMLRGLNVGDPVSFQFQKAGSDYVITSINKAH